MEEQRKSVVKGLSELETSCYFVVVPKIKTKLLYKKDMR